MQMALLAPARGLPGFQRVARDGLIAGAAAETDPACFDAIERQLGWCAQRTAPATSGGV